MRNAVSQRLRRLRHPLMLILCLTPVLAVIIGSLDLPTFFAPAAAAWTMLGTAVCFAAPGRYRVASAAGFLAAGGAVLALVFGPGKELALLLPCAVLLFMALPMAAWDDERALHSSWLMAGVAGYAVLQGIILYPGSSVQWKTPLFSFCCGALFLVFLCALLFYLNHQALMTAAQRRQQAPRGVRWRNRALTLVFFALVIVIAVMPWVVSALTRLAEWTRDALKAVAKAILSILPDLGDGRGGGSGGGGFDAFGMQEAGEPSLLARVLEYVLMVLAALLLLALIVFVVIQTVKGIRHLIRKLLAYLNSRLQAASEDYVDEVEDTRDDPGDSDRRHRLRRNLQERRGRNPRERLRFHFRKILRRHLDWAPGVTAREKLPPDAASLYEKARYSEHEITEQDEKAFEQGTAENKTRSPE